MNLWYDVLLDKKCCVFVPTIFHIHTSEHNTVSHFSIIHFLLYTFTFYAAQSIIRDIF